MYIGDNNKNVLAPITSGAKILTGTRATITNQARNLIHNVNNTTNNFKSQMKTDNSKPEGSENLTDPKTLLPRKQVVEQAQKLIKEDAMYVPPSQMGQGTTMVHNVVNPYNPKRKSKSIVDQKNRYATKKDIYPKMKVDNSEMEKRVRKVRTYLYKGANGLPVATKLENRPQQPYIATSI